MKKIHFLLCLLTLAVTFSSCESNDNSSSGQNDDTFAQNFGNAVSKDFIGQVVDIDNHPLQGVIIKIGTSTVQTDVNGVFILNGASVYQKFAYITAKKAGYIDGSRAMVPTNGKNNVRIMLLPNAPLETIQSGIVSEVSIYSGVKVKFQGGFQDENGNDYAGTVQVSMFHLTPSDENISRLMPGMLYAQTATNQEAILETYGMLNVELRGSAGQKLNIKAGQTAEITIRIDDSQLATAPNSIPLWHFDEEKGYWKEDGVATKVGNKYVGEVSHFSWWNCDAFAQMVTLTVTVLNGNGNPISNVGVGLIANGNTYPVMGFTNNDGQVSGLIPTNQTLTLNVYASYNTCGVNNLVYTSTIGPFSTNTTLTNITINNSSTTLSSTVEGTLVKCDNTNVTNGYVVLKRVGGTSFFPIANGSFSFNEIYCVGNTQFTLKGVDVDDLQQTDSIHYNFASPKTNVGSLQTCDTVDEFITFQIDSNPTIHLVNVNGQLNGGPNVFVISGYQGLANENGIFITVINTDNTSTFLPGIYSYGLSNRQFQIQSPTFGVNYQVVNSLQLNLNQFDAIGGYIDLTFGGNYYDYNGILHYLTGVAHVIRDF